MKKGQVATEYLVIVGFALLAMVPLLILYATESGNVENRVNANQAMQIARLIVDSSETVYYLGPPSKTTLKVYLPTNIETITFTNTKVIFQLELRGGMTTDIVQEGKVNMTGTIDNRRGIRHITIQATDTGVVIS